MVQWVHNIDGDASLLARRRLLTGARGRQCRFCRRENYSASSTAASERTSSRSATSDHDDDGIATNRVATVAARPTVTGSPRDCVTLEIGMARSAARSLTSLLEGPLFEPTVKKQAHAILGLVCGNIWLRILDNQCC